MAALSLGRDDLFEKRLRDYGNVAHDDGRDRQEEGEETQGSARKKLKASTTDMSYLPNMCDKEGEEAEQVIELCLADKEKVHGGNLEWVEDFLESDNNGEVEGFCDTTVMDDVADGTDFCMEQGMKNGNFLPRIGLEEFGLQLLLEESGSDDANRETEEGGDVDDVSSPFLEDVDGHDDVDIPEVSCLEGDGHLCDLGEENVYNIDNDTGCHVNDDVLAVYNEQHDQNCGACDRRKEGEGCKDDVSKVDNYKADILKINTDVRNISSGLTKLSTTHGNDSRKGLTRSSDVYFGFLLEASDDQLGIPPSPSGLSESSSLLQSHQDGNRDVSSSAFAKSLPLALPVSGLASSGLFSSVPPATGFPSSGLLCSGSPSTGLPSSGLPYTGVPYTGFQGTAIDSVLWEEEGSTGPEGVYETSMNDDIASLSVCDDMASFDSRSLQESSLSEERGMDFTCSGTENGAYNEGFILDTGSCLEVDLLELNYGPVLNSKSNSDARTDLVRAV